MQYIFSKAQLLVRTALAGVLLFSTLTLLAPEAQAAYIRLTPTSVALTVAPGETASVPVSATLAAASRGEFSTFTLASMGNEANAWFDNSPSIILWGPGAVGSASLNVRVPADAKGGNYTARFAVSESRTSGRNIADDFLVTIEVPAACQQAPTISSLNATKTTINPQANKPYTLTLTGKVDADENCSTLDAWYDLDDEYAEMSEKHVALDVQEDGTFSTEITVMASRDGKDKDGRSYSITLNAANEAGEATPKAVELLVAHDNRK